MKNLFNRPMSVLCTAIAFSMCSVTVLNAQTQPKLWEAKLGPSIALNLKSGLKGPGYVIGVSRQIKNGFKAEIALSGSKFKSPGTFNPKGSSKFPASTSSIDFTTKTWEIGCYKTFNPENDFRPVVGLGFFKRSWKETIVENGAKTSLDQSGSSGGLTLSAGFEKTMSDRLNLQSHLLMQTNSNFYSILSFRIGVGYRFGLI